MVMILHLPKQLFFYERPKKSRPMPGISRVYNSFYLQYIDKGYTWMSKTFSKINLIKVKPKKIK